YLPRDEELILALKRMALRDRRLILITNSEWYYTHALCAHLFDHALPGVASWRDIFDLVVVSAGKPGFFRKERPFKVLDDQGEEVGEVDEPQWGGVYAGGSREGLARLLGGTGEEMLYVGDHIYGDILSSKLTSTWRTALVVSELEDELQIRQGLTAQHRHMDVLRAELADFGQRMDDLNDVLTLYRQLDDDSTDEESERAIERTKNLLATLRGEHKAMRKHVRRLQGHIGTAINPYWGSLFKQGSNKSLFGSQVDDFACVYTSRVSNFAFYGSNHYFRVLLDSMMHEESI
ncbi:MAG: 5'-nucleotidase domain-containing protein, partial [Acidobacteriota bacterium]